MPAAPIPLLLGSGIRADYLIRLGGLLGLTPSGCDERAFADGERAVRPLDDPAGREVWVAAALHPDRFHGEEERLCRLLFLLATLRDLGAAGITLMVPYLPYARQDRRQHPLDPLCGRYLYD